MKNNDEGAGSQIAESIGHIVFSYYNGVDVTYSQCYGFAMGFVEILHLSVQNKISDKLILPRVLAVQTYEEYINEMEDEFCRDADFRNSFIEGVIHGINLTL